MTSSKITNCDPHLIVWYNRDCLWAGIPKNANMVYRNICRQLSMEHQPKVLNLKEFNAISTESVCVLRNPVYRLFSGLGEYKKRQGHKNKEISTLLEELLKDPFDFDEHLEPQLVYIEGRAYTHILAFENLLEETLTVDYFKKHEHIIEKAIRPMGERSKYFNEPISDLYEQHKSIVDDIISKYYQKDLKMWQNRQKYVGTIITADNI